MQVTEGRLLDFETADAMQRALHAALRTLEELRWAFLVTLVTNPVRAVLTIRGSKTSLKHGDLYDEKIGIP